MRFIKLRTFNDLLCIVGKELAERGPLGPFQGVEQLLDLCGHSAAHRNSYKQDEGGEGQCQDKHTVKHTPWLVCTKHYMFKLLTISLSAALLLITQEKVFLLI